jgi:hypothetical protein
MGITVLFFLASIFKTEEMQVGKVAGYIEVEGKNGSWDRNFK